jgi:hypothetical protein
LLFKLTDNNKGGKMKNTIQNINPNILGVILSLSMILAGVSYYMYTSDISGSMVLITVGLSTAVMFGMLLTTKASNINPVSP